MKKLALGIGILALSALSFSAEVSKDVTVTLGATISGVGQEVKLYDKSSGSYVDVTGGITITHVASHFGNLILPKSKTIVAMLKPVGGGIALSLTDGRDTVTARFENEDIILDRGGAEAHHKFNSELTVNDTTPIANSEKTLIITSTPAENSKAAEAGTYSGTGKMIVTINKL